MVIWVFAFLTNFSFKKGQSLEHGSGTEFDLVIGTYVHVSKSAMQLARCLALHSVETHRTTGIIKVRGPATSGHTLLPKMSPKNLHTVHFISTNKTSRLMIHNLSTLN